MGVEDRFLAKRIQLPEGGGSLSFEIRACTWSSCNGIVPHILPTVVVHRCVHCMLCSEKNTKRILIFQRKKRSSLFGANVSSRSIQNSESQEKEVEGAD